jgi:uncharacterized membrane protein
MLLFLVGTLWSVLVGRWWSALGCVVGFVIAAIVIRCVSTVEHEASSGESIVFL